MTRPDWETIWLALARSIAQRSVDTRLQVGCVIVDHENRHVLAVGYNGDEVGGANVADSVEPGASGFVHAEVNALIKSRGVAGGTAYVTHLPCPVCARALVNARIARVVYGEAYRDMRGVRILEAAGVDVDHVNGWA